MIALDIQGAVAALQAIAAVAQGVGIKTITFSSPLLEGSRPNVHLIVMTDEDVFASAAAVLAAGGQPRKSPHHTTWDGYEWCEAAAVFAGFNVDVTGPHRKLAAEAA